MTATTATTNGKAGRRQLADQLDRMDGVIDALADGLPAAVADACREGARAAVKEIVAELLASPDLRALLGGPRIDRAEVPPVRDDSDPPRRPSRWDRLKAGVAAAGAVVADAVADGYAAARDTLIGPDRRTVAVLLTVGVAAAAAGVLTPANLVATVAAVGTASAACAALVCGWARSALGRLGFC